MGTKAAAHTKISPPSTPRRQVSARSRVSEEYLRKQGYMEGNLEELSQVRAVLLDLLSMLRAQHWLSWNTHWMVKGPTFYGDHLLFERIYTALPEDVDALAEKVMGYFGGDAICPMASMQLSMNWMQRWTQSSGCLHRRYLASEDDLQAAVKIAYEALKQAGHMPLGLDDFLMSLASSHETNIYLIQQVLAGKGRTASAQTVVAETGLAAPIFERVSTGS